MFWLVVNSPVECKPCWTFNIIKTRIFQTNDIVNLNICFNPNVTTFDRDMNHRSYFRNTLHTWMYICGDISVLYFIVLSIPIRKQWDVREDPKELQNRICFTHAVAAVYECTQKHTSGEPKTTTTTNYDGTQRNVRAGGRENSSAMERRRGVEPEWLAWQYGRGLWAPLSNIVISADAGRKPLVFK